MWYIPSDGRNSIMRTRCFDHSTSKNTSAMIGIIKFFDRASVGVNSNTARRPFTTRCPPTPSPAHAGASSQSSASSRAFPPSASPAPVHEKLVLNPNANDALVRVQSPLEPLRRILVCEERTGCLRSRRGHQTAFVQSLRRGPACGSGAGCAQCGRRSG